MHSNSLSHFKGQIKRTLTQLTKNSWSINFNSFREQKSLSSKLCFQK